MSIQPINGVVDAYFNLVYDVLGSLSTYPSYPLWFQSHVVGVDGMKLMCMGTHHVSIWIGAQQLESLAFGGSIGHDTTMSREPHELIGPSVRSHRLQHLHLSETDLLCVVLFDSFPHLIKYMTQ